MKMNGIIRFIKSLFGKYEPGYEYWVYLRDIKISPEFERTPPKFKKMGQKWNYYRNTGEFESPIILNRDFVLIDGYTSYIIAKKSEMDKVPVYFVD